MPTPNKPEKSIFEDIKQGPKRLLPVKSETFKSAGGERLTKVFYGPTEVNSHTESADIWMAKGVKDLNFLVGTQCWPSLHPSA